MTTTALTTTDRAALVEAIRERLRSVYDTLDIIQADERPEALLALTEAWDHIQSLASQVDEAAARNTALATMFDTLVAQRDDMLDELHDLHSLQNAVKHLDMQDRRLRKFAAEILAGNGEYVTLIDDLEDEDMHDRLTTMIANRLNLGHHAASDLADLLVDDWADDVPYELAADLAQAVDNIRQHYRGWKG